ncbi:MAG TPA: hypothetical protein VIM13_13685 [Clostridia bacterium]
MYSDFMNRRKMRTVLQFGCIFLVLLIMLSACSRGKRADNAGNGHVPAEPAEDSQPSVGETEENGTGHTETGDMAEDRSDKTAEHDNVSGNGGAEISVGPELDDFLMLDEFFKNHDFDVSYDEKQEFHERTYMIHGTYDMNGDGEEDEITLLIKTDCSEGSYIEVNGKKLTIGYGNFSGETRLIDLDSRDSYTEIAVFDDGPSADPVLLFYRYNGEKVDFVGSIDRYSLMDGKGRFISSFHLASNFHPQFYSAWGEFRDGEYVTTNHDVDQYIGKTYEIDGSGYFVPLDRMPGDLGEYLQHTTWDWDSVREFNGTEAKILNIYVSEDDRTLNWFYIELANGERGLLYFWIGD